MATCGPVVQEVLQRLEDDPQSRGFRDAFLALPCLSDPVPRALYLEAADVYRLGRQRGLIPRSPADCLITAVAIRHAVPLWHAGSDFDRIAGVTPLRIFHPR